MKILDKCKKSTIFYDNKNDELLYWSNKHQLIWKSEYSCYTSIIDNIM